jgi:hypothetical protein
MVVVIETVDEFKTYFGNKRMIELNDELDWVAENKNYGMVHISG